MLKIVCLGLAVLLLGQGFRLAARRHPLERLTLPATLFASAASNTLSGAKATNPPPLQETATNTPNVPPTNKASNAPSRAMTAGPRPEIGKKAPDLPPAIQSRVDRITQSEILGAVIRPLPMALLGIAAHDAVLRAPNGQTGLLKEGEELGGVKLLRIGTNRVLIEHEGQKKELTVFSGFGSETLLPKEKEKPK
ncbi:MAG: hypothetical protein HY674_16450 [Chloroflexi bacterium]|nr:hypothetical protein [Chloroflexota bacterium]